MQGFQKREDPVTLMKRRFALVALLVVVLVLARGAYSVLLKERESRALRSDVEAELRDLKSREMEIRTDIAELASERGVERALRSEYELAREGESVIVIVGDDEEITEEPAPVVRPWWRFW